MSNYQIDRARWAQLTIFEQMGNIGSEVGRTIRAKESGDKRRFEAALARTLDLFSATIEVLITQKVASVREVFVAREQFLNLFFGNVGAGDEKKIENYFMQYAIAARLNR
jgi:hypothetical protein